MFMIYDNSRVSYPRSNYSKSGLIPSIILISTFLLLPMNNIISKKLVP